MGFLFAPPLAAGFFAGFLLAFFSAEGLAGELPLAGEAAFLTAFGFDFGFVAFGLAAGFFAAFGLLALLLD